MSEARKTDLFIEMYMAALRSATKNPYLQEPKMGSEKYNQLDAARKVVDEMEGDWGDFIRCQFAAMRRLKLIPSSHHMCSPKAIQRYIVHQKMKNRYHRKEYSLEGNYFTVHATGKQYEIKQVDLPTQEDPMANYAHHLANSDEMPPNGEYALECLEYAIAKLRYKDKIPTEALMRRLRQLKEEVCAT